MKRCGYAGCKSPYKGGCWLPNELTVALIDGKAYCPGHYAEVGRYDSALVGPQTCRYCDRPGYLTRTRLLGVVPLCKEHCR